MKKRITVKDLAQALQLHHTTVSKALRNHPDINSETKKRVLEIAEAMEYQPNVIARAFKSKRSTAISVIVPLIKNDFFAAVISGIEDVAYGAGYSISVSQSNERLEREVVNARAAVSSLAAGLLISVSQETRSGNHLQMLRRKDIPIVFFDRICDDVHISRVVADDYYGAVRAVEHLIARGRRSIAHLAGPGHVYVARERHRGYADALASHGLPFDEELVVRGGFQEYDGASGMQRLIAGSRRPDAVFAVNDPVATGAYAVIQKHGWRIPEDVAVAGFGDNVLSSYLQPPLTTVRQPAGTMGQAAARLLLDQIENPDSAKPPERLVMDTDLIVRQST